MQLALAMGRTLAELRSTISSDELSLWQVYSSKYGLPYNRLEGTVAIGSAVVAQSMGAKIKPIDLLPQFEQRVLTRQEMEAWALGQRK